MTVSTSVPVRQVDNRLESLVEEAHIRISSVVSDLLGTTARRLLHGVGDGETDPEALAALASDCERLASVAEYDGVSEVVSVVLADWR